MKIFQKIKSYGLKALLELFKLRKSKYDDLIKQANAFNKTLGVSTSSSVFISLSEDDDDFDDDLEEYTPKVEQAAKELEKNPEFSDAVEIDLENVTHVTDKKIKKSELVQVESSYEPPDLKSLYKNTKLYNDLLDAHEEINQMVDAFRLRIGDTIITGRRIFDDYKEDFRKIDSVTDVGYNRDAIRVSYSENAEKVKKEVINLLKSDRRQLKYITRSNENVLYVKVKEVKPSDGKLSSTLDLMEEEADLLLKSIKTVEQALSKIAKDHLPEEVKTVSKQAIKHVRRKLQKDKFEKLAVKITVSSDSKTKSEGEGFQFVSYIHIKEIDGDIDVYVAVTTYMQKLEVRYNLVTHVAVIDSFKRAGNFDVGPLVFGRGGIKNFSKLYTEIDKQLDLLNVKFDLTAIPLKIPSVKLNTMMKSVEGVVSSRIFGRVVAILIDNSVPDSTIKNEILKEAIVTLRSLLPVKHRRLNFSNYKIETTRKSKILLLTVSK